MPQRNKFVALHKTICYILPQVPADDTQNSLPMTLLYKHMNWDTTMNDQVKMMNEQFAKQTEEMMNAVKDIKVPENFQAVTEEGIAKTREAYVKVSSAAKDTTKAMENFSDAAQKNAKKMTDKVVSNLETNTNAVFKAAAAVAKAQSLPEAAKLHTDFMQKQIAIANAQTKELYEMTAKLAKKNTDAFQASTTKTMEQLKKTA